MLSYIETHKNKKLCKSIKELGDLVSGFETFGIPCIQLKLLLDKTKALNEIYNYISETDNDEIYDACNAVYTLVKLDNGEDKSFCIDLLKKVSYNIRICRRIDFNSDLNVQFVV